jgi:dihydrofolate reductase
MIRLIAAIDDKRGIANEHGIPWHGKLPTDVKYYHEKVASGDLILMGYGVYKELSKPMRGGVNYVATYEQNERFRSGFEPIYDARKFLESVEHKDVWNIGGAILFKSTLDLAHELYLTRVQGDFHCTKFFPEFEQDFELISSTEPQEENGITFHFEVWKRKAVI